MWNIGQYEDDETDRDIYGYTDFQSVMKLRIDSRVYSFRHPVLASGNFGMHWL